MPAFWPALCFPTAVITPSRTPLKMGQLATVTKWRNQASAVGLSSKHTLAIVNRGGASARDVLDFAAQIKRAVVDRFGVWLVPEPAFVGLDDEPEVEFLKRDARVNVDAVD